jgi:hypothetical protein
MPYQIINLNPEFDFAIGKVLFNNRFKPQPHLDINVEYPIANSRIIAALIMRYEFVNLECNFEASINMVFSIIKNDELSLSTYGETAYECYTILMNEFSKMLDEKLKANNISHCVRPIIHSFAQFTGSSSAASHN